MTAKRIVGVAGPALGTTVEIGQGELLIGRDKHMSVVIGDPTLSRRHAALRPEDGRVRLVDLGSAHGTLVNGTPIESRLLEPGDRIAVGRSLLVFLVHEGEGGRPRDSALEVTSTETSSHDTLELSPSDGVYLRGHTRTAASPPIADRVARDLDALLHITSLLTSILEPETLKLRILELAAEVIPAERGGILLLGRLPGEGGEPPPFESVTAWTRKRGSEREVRLSSTITRKVLSERIALLANAVLDTASFAGAESVQEARIRSVLCVPLLVVDRLIGVLYLDSSERASRFDERHLELATAIAATAARMLDTARRVDALESENRRLVAEAALRHGMIGKSPRMLEVFRQIGRMAPVDSTVLLRGESGTGKELAAHALHLNSRRAEGPFVAVSCAAIPENLLESELFGHERGAFTGAVSQKPGKLELAHDGTLLLDEVGELPLPLQAKLLRVLQARTFERVGGTKPIRADFRLVAATNRNLEDAVREGTFRQDLYYRLNVLSLTMPPLRERREDVPLLSRHFLASLAIRLGRTSPPELAAEAVAALERYDWPGNVRELENAIERAVVLGEGDVVRPEDLPENLIETGEGAESRLGRYHDGVNEAKRQILVRALAEASGVVTEAAKILGLNSNYLHRLMKNLGVKARPGS